MRQFIKTTLLLLALLLPATATAHDFEVDGIYYNINGNEATVTYKGTSFDHYSNEYSGDVTIPATVTYNGTTYNVTSIGDAAFYECSGLISINIPNSVTAIGQWTFDYCSGLRRIQVENGNPTYDSRDNCNAIIETSTNMLFAGCMNTVIPNSVTSIGVQAFCGCSGLTSITIPNSVTHLEALVFQDCINLTSITFPNSVIDMITGIEGHSTFYYCSNLTTIFLTGDGNYWNTWSLPEVATFYIDKGITGVTYLCDKSNDVFSFAVTPPTCEGNPFSDYSGTLHVPAASLAAYFTAPYWCNFANIVGDAVKPNGLCLEKDSLDLVIQETATLATTISPASATSNIINWASNNPNVATVVNGQVTAVGLGECDIVALCADQKAVCHVVVYNDRISVDQPEAQILPNHIITLTPTSVATTLPSLVVTSSDPTVAAARVMNGKVQVVGVSEGTATITVASTDGTAKPATCMVTVYTELGDANGDGFIDIDDVTKLIERVLGNEATDIKEKNDDLNNDGVLDIDDVTALINTILGTT